MKRKSLLLLSFVLILCSCGKEYKGTWTTIQASGNIKGYIDKEYRQSNITNPFNTSMVVRYFLNDDNEDNDKLKDDVAALYSDKVKEYHKLFDRHYYYKDDNDNLINNIKVINDSYGTGTEVVVDERTYDLLKLSISCYEMTDGLFNIFTGSISDYWKEIFDKIYDYEPVESVDPYYNQEQKELLEKLVEQVPNTKEKYERQLTFNDANKSVIFNKIDGLYDNRYRPYITLGGVAKGYATDLIRQDMIDNIYLEGLLVSGGSSICTIDKPIYSKEAKGQSISVRNPNTIDSVAFSIKVAKRFAFSTSGNYTSSEHYRFLDEKTNKMIYRHHIINPFDGYPTSYHRSISILGYDLSNAYLDILSTALMNVETSKAKAFIDNLKDTYHYDFEVIYLDQDDQDYDNYSMNIYATSKVNGTLSSDIDITLL